MSGSLVIEFSDKKNKNISLVELGRICEVNRGMWRYFDRNGVARFLPEGRNRLESRPIGGGGETLLLKVILGG